MNRFARMLFAGLLLAWGMTGAFAAELQFKTRGIWGDPPAFTNSAGVDRMIERCKEAGLNLLIPNVMWRQCIYFKSPHFAGQVRANDAFDPLADVVAKAHAAGIKVQAWCCVYYEGAVDDANTALHPAWLVRSFAGRPFEKNFLSPANPEVNPYLLSVMKDLLAYDIDGIHLDYIRYPCSAFDYSDAARAAFKAEHGFDPQDLLDHVERIVPPAEEKYPVRVLEPRAHVEDVGQTTVIERTLDQAGLGFGFVSELPKRIKELRVPGLLIVSSYTNPPLEMIKALSDYAARGGDILWTPVPAADLATSPALQKLTGVRAATALGERRIMVARPENPALAELLSLEAFRDDTVLDSEPGTATVIAHLASGQPAILVNQIGKGRVVTMGFHLMRSTSPVAADLAKELVSWFKLKAGVEAGDPLAAKRAEWIAWRDDRVTQLVRDIHTAAKQRNPRLIITSSGGPSPFEFYACYRNARRWLSEGVNEEVYPMDYTLNPTELSERLELQAASAPNGIFNRIVPGIEIFQWHTADDGKKSLVPIDPAIVEQELHVVQQQGCPGFVLYSYACMTDDTIKVVKKFGN
jgi:uncharacterized lipoprotein YddW (UPF0748 family)